MPKSRTGNEKELSTAELEQRDRARDTLDQDSRVLRTLVANLPGFAYRCRNDTDWTMEYLGGQVEKTTGYPPEALLKNRDIAFNDLITEEHQSRLWKKWQELLKQHQPIEDEYTIRTRDGSIRWVWERGRGVFDDEGNLLALEGVIVDITDRKRAQEERQLLEEQLRQSQKLEAIGQLAGGIAHDFNNILTVILGHIELNRDIVEQDLGREHEVYRAMIEIEHSAERAANLTRQLLAFSRKDVTQPKLVNLNEVLSDIDVMLRRLITENITLETTTDTNLPQVWVDQGRIEQVIVNLIVNSVHAMPDGGRITLETRDVFSNDVEGIDRDGVSSGRYALLIVTDTGQGMDAATQKKLFEPFFTTKPSDKGTGLGLASVHGIIKQSRGHVTFDSAPGMGTSFKIYLPAAERPQIPTRATKTSITAKGGQETILLCEDEDSLRDLTAQMLRAAGYTVLTAHNGAAGLTTAADHPEDIHLLVTDVIMPDINGRQLSEGLKKVRPTLLTLFVSGYTNDVIAHHGVLEKGVFLLEKPFTKQALLNKIRDVLAQREDSEKRDE